MKILNNISTWFADLQSRERVIVTFGAALLIVAALYMALLPAIQKNSELEQRYKSLSEDMQWLREQSAVVSRLDNSCSSRAIQTGKQREVIADIVRKNQLKLISLNQNGRSLYSLLVYGDSANRVLQLIHQLTCQGLVLDALTITSSSEPKAGFSADIEVIYVD